MKATLTVNYSIIETETEFEVENLEALGSTVEAIIDDPGWSSLVIVLAKENNE